jgi:hypothetical protein
MTRDWNLYRQLTRTDHAEISLHFHHYTLRLPREQTNYDTSTKAYPKAKFCARLRVRPVSELKCCQGLGLGINRYSSLIYDQTLSVLLEVSVSCKHESDGEAILQAAYIVVQKTVGTCQSM